jgi:hypothetical protein
MRQFNTSKTSAPTTANIITVNFSSLTTAASSGVGGGSSPS